MPNPKLIGLFLIFIFQIGCGLSAPSENRRVASLELITVYPNAAPIATEIPIEEATVLKPQDFVGCWSSGSGNVILYSNLIGFMSFGSVKSSLIAVIVLAISSFLISTAAQVQSSAPKNDQNYIQFATPDLELKLSRSSQTAVGLVPKDANGFDF